MGLAGTLAGQWREGRDGLRLLEHSPHSFRKTLATLVDEGGLPRGKYAWPRKPRRRDIGMAQPGTLRGRADLLDQSHFR